MIATCTHAHCQDCDWQPDPTSKRGPDTQADAHVRRQRHSTITHTQPAEECDQHRDRP